MTDVQRVFVAGGRVLAILLVCLSIVLRVKNVVWVVDATYDVALAIWLWLLTDWIARNAPQ